MLKPNHTLLQLALLTAAIASLAGQPASAQFYGAVLSQEGAPAREEPPRGSQNTEVVLQDLMTILAREEPPQGSRGQFLCAVNPGLLGGIDVVWSDRPMFVWQGEAKQIVLRNFDTQERIWSQPLGSTDQYALYTGTPLEPGQVYEWELSNGLAPGARFIFQVMEPSERTEISSDLSSLEQQLKTTHATPEDIAAQRAHYFAERRLWSDSLQSLQELQNPSVTVTQALAEMSNRVCGSHDSQ